MNNLSSLIVLLLSIILFLIKICWVKYMTELSKLGIEGFSKLEL